MSTSGQVKIKLDTLNLLVVNNYSTCDLNLSILLHLRFAWHAVLAVYYIL
jgi:hypothetical protein